ncbi:trimethylamine methyltransferase MttB [Sinorhizobium medicae]|nr:trimethylamine methyltransferase MttB [Sinorhizobium medicae]
MMGFLEPMPFSEDDLGFDAIKSVPAGGHFFGSEHTMARYETAFYQPMLSNWQNYGSWQEAGGHDALERATGIWQQALREYEEPVLDPAIREELDAYMIKRRAEIGAGEP